MRKRALIIVENASVPFDSRVWKEALSLHRSGYSVAVLCPRQRRYERSRETLDGIEIYRHPAAPERSGAVGYLSEYVCALFWELLYASWIYFRRGFDILQACNPPDDIFLVALPFKLMGVKFVFDHHDAAPELYVAKFSRAGFIYDVLLTLERWTYRVSDVILCTNQSYKALAIKRGRVDPRNVFVVRNGPDLATFKPVPPNPRRKQGKNYLVCYVGTMGEQDGLDILVDVAAHLKRLGSRDVHFTCVGDGPELPRLESMARDKDVEDTLTFTGRVSDEELREILSTADVCVNPDKPCQMNSISTMIKIMEYMAFSKPIVQFESVEGRFSAQDASLYADPRNQVVDFASKIRWLLENPAERARMGTIGRKRVEEELAWDYSVANLLAAYDKAAGTARNSEART